MAPTIFFIVSGYIFSMISLRSHKHTRTFLPLNISAVGGVSRMVKIGWNKHRTMKFSTDISKGLIQKEAKIMFITGLKYIYFGVRS